MARSLSRRALRPRGAEGATEIGGRSAPTCPGKPKGVGLAQASYGGGTEHAGSGLQPESCAARGALAFRPAVGVERRRDRCDVRRLRAGDRAAVPGRASKGGVAMSTLETPG